MGGTATPDPWDKWWDVQYNACREIDDLLAKTLKGKSRPFKVAFHAALIEHLAERMRSYVDLPAELAEREGW
jgi:hypothetical protein